MGNRMRVLVGTCAASALAGFVAQARADDAAPPSDNEKKLEKRVEELERQLADVNRRLAESGASRAGDELASRVEELEKLSRKDKDGLFGFWNNGIRMDSANGAFKLKIGGRVQNDWSWFWSNGEIEDATGAQVEAGEEFRRARLYVGGTMYSNVDFMAEFDFAGGTSKFRNVWMQTNFCGLATLRVGHFKEPFGLEESTDDLFINFLERHAPSEAFAPSYDSGAMLFGNCDENVISWQLGAFRDANEFGDDKGNASSGEVNWTARVTGRPWIGGDDEFLHVGAAASRRTPSGELVTLAAHPEMHLAPILVSTGALDSNQVMAYELESGFESGPFHGEAEYYRTNVDGAHGMRDAHFTGWSAQAGWFLTGESRPYVTSNGTFGRVVPRKNFDQAGGMGAWQLLARYDSINLSNNGVNGGHMKTLSAGVNWYLNPNTEIMLDWVHSHVIDLGSLNGLEVRFQFDF